MTASLAKLCTGIAAGIGCAGRITFTLLFVSHRTARIMLRPLLYGILIHYAASPQAVTMMISRLGTFHSLRAMFILPTGARRAAFLIAAARLSLGRLFDVGPIRLRWRCAAIGALSSAG